MSDDGYVRFPDGTTVRGSNITQPASAGSLMTMLAYVIPQIDEAKRKLEDHVRRGIIR